MPSITVPSASTSTAVGRGSTHGEGGAAAGESWDGMAASGCEMMAARLGSGPPAVKCRRGAAILAAGENGYAGRDRAARPRLARKGCSMPLRDEFREAMKEAMRAGDKTRLSTMRLITSTLKDRDIEARGAGKGEIGEPEIVAMLQKMVKQRHESAAMYEKGGRAELAAQENAEIAIITGFLPRQMDEAAVAAAIKEAIAATGASGIKDMGKVMARLKESHAGSMDFAKAGPMVKAALAG
jgi:uncharacterized protein YqeY